ncbi:phosphatase 2C-like domain-containing protein [Chaetomium strumarium]|uniref:Protein phosphatase n=1 Tax=Chaetomium strumarium TaxID=1170767 RepID=A0AAJ0H282_9PEZI|nr:phosphatase 2C-like domain-containing protein [Chaetomium strumarium]
MAGTVRAARVFSLPCRATPMYVQTLTRTKALYTTGPVASFRSTRQAARTEGNNIPATRVTAAVSAPRKQRHRAFGLPALSPSKRAYSTDAPSPSTQFVYNVAASYIAKGRRYDPSTHVYQFNPYNRVQPPKAGREKASRAESGQDAFFVSRLGAVPGEVALGVADGVGGWMDSGVDPADFSHAFCDYMAAAAGSATATATKGDAAVPLTARQLMQKGYEAVYRDPAIKAGGSTAIVGLLTSKGMLEVANLGDSGFILLRLNGVHAFSEPQTHAFNTPYQLSVVPPSMLLRAAAFGGAQLMDQPRDAEVSRHRLRHGDVLVFASDGLWDNLFNQDVLRIVSRTMVKVGAWATTDRGVQVAPDLRPYIKSGENKHATLQSTLATEIVGAAKAASVNTKLDGPFAKEVKKYYPHEVWRGGKEDDICVVVVLVAEEEVLPKANL